MTLKNIGALFLLAALWGASFLFIRIAAPVLGPFLTIELRVGIAGLALLLYALDIKKTPNYKAYWKQFLILGALNAAIPFTLIATAALNLNASITAILNSTTPLFTALISWAWLKESLTIKRWSGIFMGIIGVVILVGWSPIPLNTTTIIAALLSILATISYGFAGVYAKKAFTGVPPLSTAIGQQIGAALLLLPMTLTTSKLVPVSQTVALSILGLSLLCTAIAYLLYFYLIASVGPTKTLSVTLLIPLFGILWGVIFLNETLTAGMLVGLVVVLSSVVLISDLKVPLPFRKARGVEG